MSRRNSPHKVSPGKQRHKGMKTSLYRQQQRQPTQRLQSNRYITQNNPSRIFVQTITEQPNVLPYINSDYSNQPMVSPANSEYVMGMGRQNNLIPQVGTKNTLANNVRVSPVVFGQDLSKTKIEGHYQSRAPQMNNASTYIPPPPESFLIPNSASTKVIQNRPLSKTVIHSIPVTNLIPVQNVKKTFIPHHIINQIPVYSGTVYSQSVPQQQPGNSNDESQQVLMGYYEKLYGKYEAEKQRSAQINQQLKQAVDEINYWKSQAQSQQNMQANIRPPAEKRTVIDKQRLRDLLMSKWSPIIEQVVQSRKSSCLHQVAGIIQSRRVSIKMPTEVYQQHRPEYMYSQR